MPGPGSVTRVLSGWGRFPTEPARVYRPEKVAEVAAIWANPGLQGAISRGLGRSYGDAALNRDGAVIDQTHLNRLLAFEAASGALECEAGASLADIVQTFLPRGFFLPVTPGTQFVTVGGAIAADVHGKNHHRDGSFTNFVDWLDLLTPGGQLLRCSREDHPDVFWATAGGMGLTGSILRARMRLRRVDSAWVLMDCVRAAGLEALWKAMERSDDQFEYSVAWVDATARGGRLGRGVLMQARHAAAGQVESHRRKPLAWPRRAKLSVPFDFPAWALSHSTVSAFNRAYYHGHAGGLGMLVDFESFFYPLDRLRRWNRMYGRRGFVQYQVVLPHATARQGVATLLERFAETRRASFLAVLKRLGEASGGLFSFPMPGYTLALDIPCDSGLAAFLQRLDGLVAEWGGRAYLAKDSTMSAEHFAATYPRLEEFRSIQRRVDPYGVARSSLARRLKILE